MGSLSVGIIVYSHTKQRRFQEMSKIIFGLFVFLICIVAEDLRLQVEKDASLQGFNKLQLRTGRETRAKQERKLNKQKRGRKGKLERKRKEKTKKRNRKGREKTRKRNRKMEGKVKEKTKRRIRNEKEKRRNRKRKSNKLTRKN